ncbi:DOPA 4,5-dioxygenase family protein [Caenimonas sp. SL110]|uniref:DOPA 4,5-dioxygenase family protein n=1 Tax=Caenimonas sp. SL110 TaxID=1450524 RepID=UPI000653AD64|nr:DOPA 4,5-dioxygenase family protein [Caenimonas sp. SL110]
MARYPQNLTPAYHAHIYYDAQTLEQARALRKSAGEQFNVQLGRVHEMEVGPHPRWSSQIAFDASQFERLVPWLDANRHGLDILVHGLSGNDLEDHTTHAYWLGNEWPLKLEMFREK